MKPQEALTAFFVNANSVAMSPSSTKAEIADGLYAEIDKLAERLGVDMTADGDTIEMAIVAKMKEPI